MARLCGVAALASALSLGLAASAQQGLDQTTQRSADLNDRDKVVITGMVPIPDVGPGAPRFTSDEVKALEDAASKSLADASSDMAKCGGDPFRAMMACKPGGGASGILACEVEAADKAENMAGKAAKATRAAEDVRRRAAAGKATSKEVEDAELARQVAVNKMEKARQKFLEQQAQVADMQDYAIRHGVQLTTPIPLDPDQARRDGEKIRRINTDLAAELMAKSLKREKAGWGLGVARPSTPPGISLEGIEVRRLEDANGDYIQVAGAMKNANNDAVSELPGLSVTLIDVKGFPLNTITVFADGEGGIPAGQSRPFQLAVRPAPVETQRAIVSFASAATPPPRIHMNGLICPRG
ncbi:MAG TPA: hypothetical protein VG942_10910 [Hyphomonadaceae bacterium]|nr:hypothetical protein [Hyphomonadaceae bacterium]